MANRKGVKHYPESFKLQIKAEHAAGASLNSLCRKYGMSFYSAESWCGLRQEVNRRPMALFCFVPNPFCQLCVFYKENYNKKLNFIKFGNISKKDLIFYEM